jgi:hypothetical protein
MTQAFVQGVIPLVIDVHSADIMASLLILKAEVEYKIGSMMRMVFSGATEAHLLATDISECQASRTRGTFPITKLRYCWSRSYTASHQTIPYRLGSATNVSIY